MTGGERRFAQRLESKLEDDYLCWYDVSIGEKTRHPDFVIFHPRRGVLVLEVKDWRLATIDHIDKSEVTLNTERGMVAERNPLEQARDYMFVITNKLERDEQLVFSSGSHKGKLFFPYAHGVVLTNITRKEFDSTDISEVIAPHLVICRDEMTESVDPEDFQQRMWNMFPIPFKAALSLPQIDRIRWHMFPEVRIPAQPDMFDDAGGVSTQIPDLLRVMDIQQEQLARSLGEGHRVIHGVAGSGKTLILGYRAEHLAKVCQRPILILCYNTALAAKLADVMHAKGLQDKVNAVNFHAWCVRQLNTYHVGVPQGLSGDAFYDACVNRVIESVDRKMIPSGQYDAILIDEGHDFRPEWFKLVVQMIHPDSQSLLVLYDDAQSIYGGKNKLKFSFSSVGVEARGRTTILKVNYRNTVEILSVAQAFANELLNPPEAEDDHAPTVLPMSAGRRGPKPLLIKLPSIPEEAEYLATKLRDSKDVGLNWNDMAITCRTHDVADVIENVLKRMKIPVQRQGGKTQGKRSAFSYGHDSVKVMTMHSSKGLEFPLVCIPSVGVIHGKVDNEKDEEKLLYVAMTRAMDELVMTYREDSPLVGKLQKVMGAA